MKWGTFMRKRKLVAAAIAAALIPVAAISSPSVQASSHREAPLISQDPVADNTDLYLFRDVANPAKVDIVANYIGLEDGSERTELRQVRRRRRVRDQHRQQR